jgi:hypothetical protein
MVAIIVWVRGHGRLKLGMHPLHQECRFLVLDPFLQRDRAGCFIRSCWSQRQGSILGSPVRQVQISLAGRGGNRSSSIAHLVLEACGLTPSLYELKG